MSSEETVITQLITPNEISAKVSGILENVFLPQQLKQAAVQYPESFEALNQDRYQKLWDEVFEATYALWQRIPQQDNQVRREIKNHSLNQVIQIDCNVIEKADENNPFLTGKIAISRYSSTTGYRETFNLTRIGKRENYKYVGQSKREKLGQEGNPSNVERLLLTTGLEGV